MKYLTCVHFLCLYKSPNLEMYHLTVVSKCYMAGVSKCYMAGTNIYGSHILRLEEGSVLYLNSHLSL